MKTEQIICATCGESRTWRGFECLTLCSCLTKPEPPKEHNIDEAADLIAFIGTIGAERTDVLKRAQDWLKGNGYEHLL